ncbi:hypothetical protein FDH27_gp044 [Vibrio phage SSP002]|uniref:Uncharacterized protein n=1 Tax=Vibrio phage SSP002 TaxID=1161928 RepID=H9EB44_9CAUD|nr:hypothetical protein FDH27_gp044 [Vibrio phage SSP002]AFE86371.1 hypothetical protein SSP002_044 [Vibrio phage SSP002]
MGYENATYNSRVELGQKFATAITNLGGTVKRQYQNTINGEPAYQVIVQVASDVFMHYDFRWHRWYSRRGTYRYREGMFTKMGTAYVDGADTVSGEVSSNFGPGGGGQVSTNWDHIHQYLPIPGKVHVARNSATGEFVLCMENPADSKSVLHGVGRIIMQDTTFGPVPQWWFDGEYHYRDANSVDGVYFMENTDGTGRSARWTGQLQQRDSAGTVTGYEAMGAADKAWQRPMTGYQPLGRLGLYSAIVGNLSFEPSLTSIFLPALWCGVKGTDYTIRAPRGDRPTFKICNMRYLGVGQEIIYNNQSYRVFPCLGKGGESTPGIAFLVGAAS